jgi:hypothetical protein
MTFPLSYTGIEHLHFFQFMKHLVDGIDLGSVLHFNNFFRIKRFFDDLRVNVEILADGAGYLVEKDDQDHCDEEGTRKPYDIKYEHVGKMSFLFPFKKYFEGIVRMPCSQMDASFIDRSGSINLICTFAGDDSGYGL